MGIEVPNTRGSRVTGYIQRYFGKKVYFKDIMRVSKIYFSDDELKCKCGCNGLRLNYIFDSELMELRKAMNEPMFVNSCCRCKAHNIAVGGNARSLHVYDKPAHPSNGTCAIDIMRKNKSYDLKLLLEAWDAGWSVGVTPTFFHLDTRTDVLKMPQVMFAYAGKTDMKELERFKKLVGA